MQPASGYTLILPPGWTRIPLLHGTDAAVKKLLDDSFAHLPRDRVAPYRIELDRRLRTLIADARRNAGVDLYFPAGLTDSGPLPASFLISRASYTAASAGAGSGTETRPGRSTHPDPAQVLAFLASQHPGARPVEIDGTPAVRTEHVAPPAPAAEFRYGTRRVEYTLAVPGDPGRWLVAAFATPGAADPDSDFARLLAELFDAIMLTFRWVTAPAAPSAGHSESV